jgi:restriction system protein
MGTPRTGAPILDEVGAYSGIEFERFLKTLFERMGYGVASTKITGDQGADLIVTKDGERIVVQAKRSAAKVGNRAVQQAVAAIKYYRADRALVVATNEFTPAAVKLATANSVELVDRNRLARWIREFA